MLATYIELIYIVAQIGRTCNIATCPGEEALDGDNSSCILRGDDYRILWFDTLCSYNHLGEFVMRACYQLKAKRKHE